MFRFIPEKKKCGERYAVVLRRQARHYLIRWLLEMFET